MSGPSLHLLLLIVIAASYNIFSSQAHDDHQKCFLMSKSTCKSSSRCWYDRYSEACFPYEASWHDSCYSLSKRKCDKSLGCTFDAYSNACFPSGDEVKELTTQDDLYDDDNDHVLEDCYQLSKHECKANSYCWYDRYSKW